MEPAALTLGANRRLHDALLAKGYAVRYQEVDGSHHDINWRGTFGTDWRG